MVNYPVTFKAQMVEKMLPPSCLSASDLAAKTGVAKSTLSRWLKEAGNVSTMEKTAKKWNAAEKLKLLIEAGHLSDEELGKFLRREGVHEATLKQWQIEAEEGLSDNRSHKKSKEEKRIKELERELRRKEKALAEASAILVLKKKVAAIWGDEDESTNEESEK